ncbi:MAG: hypothetical protein LUD02_11925 [Tannerellaceae bacterium]|nr:hypothetical protein [Tannerellaceae bacterium]
MEELYLFFIDVTYSIKTTIVLIDTPFYILDIENQITKENILKELELYWPYPAQRLFYRLVFEKANSGVLEVGQITDGVLETINGIFTTNAYTTIESGFTIKLENEEYEFIAGDWTIESANCMLQRDFTEEFRQKYPLNGVKRVIVASNAYQASKMIRAY